MTAKPRARTYRGTTRNLALLARKLQQGKLVAVPSETVYGLAANALDSKACRRIFTAKGRPASDPLIVHIHSLAQLEQIAVPNAAALRLAKAFWPGPLTLILPKRDIVPNEVTAGLPSVAVRMPSHPLFRRLLKLCQLPLAAPSANPFGYVSPTTAEHVMVGLGSRIDFILDGGAATIGLESTIVDLRHPARPRILRPGAITRVALQRTLTRAVSGKASKASAAQTPQIAPGLLKRHYSPKTRVMLHQKLSISQARRSQPDEAWLFLRKPVHTSAPNIQWLDSHGDLRQVARRLFAKLRKLDASNFSVIHVERASGSGLAEAINDRLRRAAAK
jgi:L-threonylcarbamoyladenylate synthase